MARPKGQALTPEHRENIRLARQWVRAFVPIRDAADAGDEREAVRLLKLYIKSRKESEAA